MTAINAVQPHCALVYYFIHYDILTKIKKKILRPQMYQSTVVHRKVSYPNHTNSKYVFALRQVQLTQKKTRDCTHRLAACMSIVYYGCKQFLGVFAARPIIQLISVAYVFINICANRPHSTAHIPKSVPQTHVGGVEQQC